MKNIILLILMTSCNTLPQLYQTAEDIINDEAIEVIISREAIQRQTDITVSVDVKNNQSANK